MKRLYLLLISVVLLSITFNSCQKEFDIITLKDLSGGWVATDIQVNEEWVKIKKNSLYETGVTFLVDASSNISQFNGNYCYSGYPGIGSGDFTAESNLNTSVITLTLMFRGELIGHIKFYELERKSMIAKIQITLDKVYTFKIKKE